MTVVVDWQAGRLATSLLMPRRWFDAVTPHRHGCPVVQCLARASGVVKADPGAGYVVFDFGPSAAIPIRRISRCTRLRLIVIPSARGSIACNSASISRRRRISS